MGGNFVLVSNVDRSAERKICDEISHFISKHTKRLNVMCLYSFYRETWERVITYIY